MPSSVGIWPPSSGSLRIVIVGGVAGGMSAATRARRLDERASITVFEKGSYPSYANCGIPYALGGIIKDDASLLLQTPQAFAERFNIDVHVNTEVIRIDPDNHSIDVKMEGSQIINTWPYDKLILAQGAEPFQPAIKGVDLPNVFTLQTIPDLKKIKTFIREDKSQSVAIIGGGFIGIEAAESLRHLEMEVSIIEYMPHILPPLDADFAGPLHEEIRRHGVNLILNARILEIEPPLGDLPSRVVVAHGDPVIADVVLLVVGQRARTALAKEAGIKTGKTGVSVNSFMQTSEPDIYAVGDMVETENRITHRPIQLALAGPASRQGRLVADHIFGVGIPYRGNVGTWACKVFDLTVASTGLSIEALRKSGQTPQWVTVHPPDHAGYYPDSHQMTLKVAFDPKTGKLLGAQAIGVSSIDKRIDVLATALQGGMTVNDLEHLELAYAPPYGSAKDPVNMAGFVASNVLRGDVKIVHAEDVKIEEGEIQVVDVRSPGEFSNGGHLPLAVNIPIDTLRDNVSKLHRNRPVLVYCQVGYRGYLAYRILEQMGFNVVNLDGGFKAVVDGGFKSLIAGVEESLL